MVRRYDEIVAPAISAGLLFVLLAGSALAVIRYTEAHDYLGAQRPAAIESVEGIASRIAAEGESELAHDDRFVATALAHPGSKGKWGRTLKPRVALRDVKDSRLVEDCLEPDCKGVFSDGQLSERTGEMNAELARNETVGSSASLVPGHEDDLFVVDTPVLVDRHLPKGGPS